MTKYKAFKIELIYDSPTECHYVLYGKPRRWFSVWEGIPAGHNVAVGRDLYYFRTLEEARERMEIVKTYPYLWRSWEYDEKGHEINNCW